MADYVFRFDALPERATFTKQIKITGWLLHRRGLPIFGIRGVVRDVFPGAPQKIATPDRGSVPRFARSGTKRVSSRARAVPRPK